MGGKKDNSSPKGQSIQWRVCPAQERAGATLLLTAFMFFLAWFLQVSWGNPLITAGAVIFLVVSLRKWFLATNYSLDNAKITITTLLGTSFFEWQQVRKARFQGRGLAFLLQKKSSGKAMLTGKDQVFVLLPLNPEERGSLAERITELALSAGIELRGLES